MYNYKDFYKKIPQCKIFTKKNYKDCENKKVPCMRDYILKT